MAARDGIGRRGEIIFCARITNFCGRETPYFRTYFLGEKAQTLDFMIERVGAGDHTRFFFVQVKTTRQGYTKKGRRLKVGMSGSDIPRFSFVPAPTYLVGIDEPQEIAFILAIVEGMTDTISSLPTDFPLDCTNLPRLYAEVEQFWADHDMARRSSVFSVQGGRP
jgi:Domain of unknown function (DUF4365)